MYFQIVVYESDMHILIRRSYVRFLIFIRNGTYVIVCLQRLTVILFVYLFVPPCEFSEGIISLFCASSFIYLFDCLQLDLKPRKKH